ncbi:hypothetical protein V8E54_014892 [Elaphomyces granulatus]
MPVARRFMIYLDQITESRRINVENNTVNKIHSVKNIAYGIYSHPDPTSLLCVKADENQTSLETYMGHILAKLQILDDLKKNLDEERVSNLEVEFPESHSRLSVTKDGDNILCGSLVLADARTMKAKERQKRLEGPGRNASKGENHRMQEKKLAASLAIAAAETNRHICFTIQ